MKINASQQYTLAAKHQAEATRHYYEAARHYAVNNDEVAAFHVLSAYYNYKEAKYCMAQARKELSPFKNKLRIEAYSNS